MKERPILFSGPMVRAILNGTKTQTRRIIKPTVKGCEVDGFCEVGGPVEPINVDPTDGDPVEGEIPCPVGQPGDRLWVRETWAHVPASAYRCSEGINQTINPNDQDMAAVYAAGWDRSAPGRWRPSIHMPRWASRITLEITAVRVERLNEISDADAKSEGVTTRPTTTQNLFACGAHNFRPDGESRYSDEFRALWQSLNGPGSWDANPWVWVIEFKRI